MEEDAVVVFIFFSQSESSSVTQHLIDTQWLLCLYIQNVPGEIQNVPGEHFIENIPAALESIYIEHLRCKIKQTIKRTIGFVFL